MFFSVELLNSKTPLGQVWLLANLANGQKNKLTRQKAAGLSVVELTCAFPPLAVWRTAGAGQRSRRISTPQLQSAGTCGAARRLLSASDATSQPPPF
jgi:hypothetical protein